MKNNFSVNSEGSSLSWHLDPSHDASYAGKWKIQIGEPQGDGVYMTLEMIIVPGCRMTSQKPPQKLTVNQKPYIWPSKNYIWVEFGAETFQSSSWKSVMPGYTDEQCRNFYSA